VLDRLLDLLDLRALALVALVVVGGCWATSTVRFCDPPYVDSPRCVLEAPLEAAVAVSASGILRHCPRGEKPVPRCRGNCDGTIGWMCMPKSFEHECADDTYL
jgi:hypothetical protein